jgi:hypothetical protein
MTLHRTFSRGSFLAVALTAHLVTAGVPTENGASHTALEMAWSLDGNWTGVGDASGLIYAVGRNGRCAQIDLSGKVQREIAISQDGGAIVRVANLAHESGKALLIFTPATEWTTSSQGTLRKRVTLSKTANTRSSDLKTYGLDGHELWSYPRANGINDVWARDLDGDGLDEVIVGYNGAAAVHLLDNGGRLRWKSDHVRNATHVCAGKVWGAALAGGRVQPDSGAQAIATSDYGKAYALRCGGAAAKGIWTPECHASMLQVVKISEEDKSPTVLIAGPALETGRISKIDTFLSENKRPPQTPSTQTAILTALDSDRSPKKWSLTLPCNSLPQVVSSHAAPGKSWLAVGMVSGQLHVVDIEKGQVIASANEQGMNPEVAWAKSVSTSQRQSLNSSRDADSPLLLVATGTKLNAFRVSK